MAPCVGGCDGGEGLGLDVDTEADLTRARRNAGIGYPLPSPGVILLPKLLYSDELMAKVSPSTGSENGL